MSSLMIIAGLIGIAYSLIQYLIATTTKLYPDPAFVAIITIASMIGCVFLIMLNLTRIIIGTPSIPEQPLMPEQGEEQEQIL